MWKAVQLWCFPLLRIYPMRKHVYSFYEHPRKITELCWFWHQTVLNNTNLNWMWSQSECFCSFFISFIRKYLENTAPAHEMRPLNGLKFSRLQTPLIAPFHSILKPFKSSKMGFVQKGLSANTTMEIVWIETSLMCFCLRLPGPLFTQRRARHTESSCSGIFGPRSL